MSPVAQRGTGLLLFISTLCFSVAQSAIINHVVRAPPRLDKRLSIARMADIYFANNDGEAKLFVNGKFLRAVGGYRLGYYRTQLFRGDVVAIEASSMDPHRGIIAQIVFVDGSPHSVTGISQWKAMAEFPATNSRDWMKRSFLACSWPLAIPPKESNPVDSFPHGIGARYVWAHESASTKRIYLRHKIDEEDCFGYGATAKIYISADNTLAFFHNGELVRRHNDFRSHVEETRDIKYGDVLAFFVKDSGGGYGLTVTIDGLGQRIESGREGFKAVKGFHIPSATDAWTLKSYSSCTWDYAVDSGGARARTLPDSFTARHIWAVGAGERDTIFVRYVVGGEHCQTQEKPTIGDCNSHCLV